MKIMNASDLDTPGKIKNAGISRDYDKKAYLANLGLNHTYTVNNKSFIINASLFESKYKSLEGIWRNTQYNGNYMGNILVGKEFKNLGEKQNQTLAINAKVFFGGGKKFIPLLRDSKGNVAVDPANNRYFDYSKAYEKSLDDIYVVNLSVSYKFNKEKTT